MSLIRLNSVIHNYLETFTSRYYDYDGYWIFGHIVEGLKTEEFNLLKSHTDEVFTPKAIIKKLAVEKFSQQLTKNQVDLSKIKLAKLKIVKNNSSIVSALEKFDYSLIRMNFNSYTYRNHGWNSTFIEMKP